MKKNTIITGILCLVVGFSIGFLWTNSVNRSVVKEAEEKVRQSEFVLANQSANSNSTNAQPSPSPDGNFHQGEIENHVEEAIQLAEQSRNDFEIQTKVGSFLYKNAKRYSKARECFEAALKIKPDDYETIVDLGNTNFDDGKLEEAAKYYEKATKIKSDDVGVRTDLGNVYFSFQPPQLEKAIEHYRISLKINSNHVPTLRNIAVALMRNKNFTEAETMLVKLSQVDPQNEELPQLKETLAKLSMDTKREIPTH